MTDAVFIAVTYQTDELALKFARQFDEPVRRFADLVVVDNSERSPSLGVGSQIGKEVGRACCLSAGENLGYFGGALYGLRRYLARNSLPEWIVISNVDVTFDPSKIVSALDYLNTIERLGVVAPRLVSNHDGSELNPFMPHRPNRLRMRTYKCLFRSYWLYTAYSVATTVARRWVGKFRSPRVDTLPRNIYAPHGAIMIFHRRFFLGGGSLSKASFLFGEEIVVAEECRRLGLSVRYTPEIEAGHSSGSSVSLIRSRQIHKYVSDALTGTVDAYF